MLDNVLGLAYFLIMHITNKRQSFGVKLKTFDVLETTSLRLFQGHGMTGVKSVIGALHTEPIKATGKVGYKHFAQNLSEKITKKYPLINDYSQKLNSAPQKDIPSILNEALSKLGKEIDIVI